MKFGIDSDGNYGYIKAGADTVTPFSSGVRGTILNQDIAVTPKTFSITPTQNAPKGLLMVETNSSSGNDLVCSVKATGSGDTVVTEIFNWTASTRPGSTFATRAVGLYTVENINTTNQITITMTGHNSYGCYALVI